MTHTADTQSRKPDSTTRETGRRRSKRKLKPKPSTPRQIRDDVLLEWVRRRVESFHRLPPGDTLGGGVWGRERVEARARATYIARAVCGVSEAGTARALGHSRRSVGRIVRRVEADREDPVLDATLETFSREVRPLLSALDGWVQSLAREPEPTSVREPSVREPSVQEVGQ